MALSSELISQFVKSTNDTETTKKETTVNGTIVEYNGSKYIKIDGSELLTPISTTVAVSDGERVTATIKDHTLTVNGNVSSPAAKNSDVEAVGTKITELDVVVANKVSTDELTAQVARIDQLTADNVTIKDTLYAENGEFQTLKAEQAEFEELTAEKFEAVTGKFETLESDFGTFKDLTAENFEATNATIHNLEVDYGEFEDLTTKNFEAVNGNITNLTAKDAEIEELVAKKIDAEIVEADYAKVKDLEATNADVDNLDADIAKIDTLIFGSASGETIQTEFANAVIAQLGNAQIKSAMIASLSASKIDTGTLNTNNINIQSEDGRLLISDETIQISDENRVRVQIGKDASGDYSINIWDAEGELMFSEGGITDNAIKEAIIRNDMVSEDANISASKLDISSLFTVINDSTETINSSKILMDADGQTLDISFTQMTSDIDDLKDDVSSQGTALSVVQGQIETKVWQQDIDTATNELGEDISTLDDKYTQVKQTVDGLESTVASHTTQISSKADGSTVTEVSNKVSSLETTVNGLSNTVSDHTTQIASKADGSTVTTINNKVTELSSDLSGFKSSVSDTYVTKTDYNTKIESVESSINQNATSIELRVTKEEFNNLEIGGRNLLVNSSQYQKDTAYYLTPTSNDHYVYLDTTICAALTAGEEYTLQCTTDGLWGAHDTDGSTIDRNCTIWLTNASNSFHECYGGDGTKSGMMSWTFTAAYTDNYCIRVNTYVAGSSTVGFWNFKIEKGNKATDWTPAPEDVDGKIDDTSDALSKEIANEAASVKSACESYTDTALGDYTKTSEFENYKETVSSELDVLDNAVNITITSQIKELDNNTGVLTGRVNEIEKGFRFTDDGLKIGETGNPYELTLDNDELYFSNNGVEVQRFDATGKALIPMLEITKMFNLLGFVIETDSYGRLNCDYVGDTTNYLAPAWANGTTTINGVTYTVDTSAGTITSEGSATAGGQFNILVSSSPVTLPPGLYRLSGAPARLDRGSRIDYSYWGLRIHPVDGRSITATVGGFTSATYTEANVTTAEQTNTMVWDKGYGAEFVVSSPMEIWASIYISMNVISSSVYTGPDTWTPKLERISY